MNRLKFAVKWYVQNVHQYFRYHQIRIIQKKNCAREYYRSFYKKVVGVCALPSHELETILVSSFCFWRLFTSIKIDWYMVYKKEKKKNDDDDIKQLERPLKLESERRVHNGLVEYI